MSGLWLSGRVKVYVDPADWWIGLYIGPNNLYFCIFTLVLRVRRKKKGREIEVPGGILTVPSTVTEEQVTQIMEKFSEARRREADHG